MCGRDAALRRTHTHTNGPPSTSSACHRAPSSALLEADGAREGRRVGLLSRRLLEALQESIRLLAAGRHRRALCGYHAHVSAAPQRNKTHRKGEKEVHKCNTHIKCVTIGLHPPVTCCASVMDVSPSAISPPLSSTAADGSRETLTLSISPARSRVEDKRPTRGEDCADEDASTC